MSMITKTRKPRSGRLLDGVPPDTRVLIVGVTWDVYESFVNAIPDGENCRVAFDGKDIEIMALGPLHETFKGRLEAFIAIVASELEIEREPMGQTTWKRPKARRGVESDLCYYFDRAKLAAHAAAVSRSSNDVNDYPNPDLAIEIDLSPSKIDRPGIYSALQVPELWRVRKKSASIQQLGPAGTYVAATSSRFLHVRHKDIMRWLTDEYSDGRAAWERRLREWVRNELAPRVTKSDPQ